MAKSPLISPLKSSLLSFFLSFMSLYLALSAIQLLFGLIDANGRKWWGACDKKMSRIEYVMPAYRLGCWLNRRPE